MQFKSTRETAGRGLEKMSVEAFVVAEEDMRAYDDAFSLLFEI